MENNKNPGYELLENKLRELEGLSQSILPSLNAFLEENKLFMTKEDLKVLKKIMTKNKKWKIINTYDYALVRRGKKK
jgi:hypothetical protein